MLIYITNRTLVKTPKTEPISLTHKEIGEKLRKPGDDNNAIYCGLAKGKYKKINFYPKGQEADLFSSISADELSKPWLVFLHGFHQDVSETIEKAYKLNQIHGVNVVLFSWPSRPNPINAFDEKGVKDQIKKYLSSLIGYATKPDLSSWLTGEIKKALKDYYSNYKPARKNAEASTNDFYAALQLINTYLRPHLKPDRISMVVHSMGNYLLRQTIMDKGNLPLMFQNIVCHQADVNASDHASWIPTLYGFLNQGLYITINKYDAVLGASSIYRISQGIFDTERMGSSTTIKPQTNHQGYISDNVKYLDFTDGRGIDNKHEIFTSISEKREFNGNYNPQDIENHIVELVTRIFTGKKDGLPKTRGKSASGFSYMPTKPNIFKPSLIIEDPDLCQWPEEWNCLMSSLKSFNDPYHEDKYNEYDPDFDDYRT